MFGGEALLAAMTDAPAPASQLVRHVLSTVARHQGDTPPADDVTLLLVRWLPPGFAADLSIPNTLPGIGEALRWIERHAGELALGRDGIEDVRLVAEDLLVNASSTATPTAATGASS